ncbi:MAG TPA: DUF4365 domain-containing protein [Desulfosporosinus sp.]|jgi:hypothetical protein|nr:DUF4365 domain-containing protein [Desulfosporosinus sp.]
MAVQYPQRHPNMTLEAKSENYFRSKLPPSWAVHKPNPDYGQDLSIEIEEGGQFRGRELIVQLKASHKPSENAEFETVSLDVASFNYLRDNLRVVLLVKYVESENEGYWLLLKDISPPTGFETQESFTIYFPRTNRISTINWGNDVVAHVRIIHEKKLRAARDSSAL